MLQEWKIPFGKILIVSLVAVVMLRACSDAPDSSKFISTPAQEKHAEAFLSYMKVLEEEGLTTAKEIRVKESQPFLFILKPQGQEITDQDISPVLQK